jgi:hypothetical protein
MGDIALTVWSTPTGPTHNILLRDVLIFPDLAFNLFSEIVAFRNPAVTATKKYNSWQFSADNRPLFHAHCALRDSLDPSVPQAAKELYYIQTAPLSPTPQPIAPFSDAPASAAAALATRTELAKPKSSPEIAPPLTKISTAKNRQMLIELHIALDHLNFPAIASEYGLSLPPDLQCWACLLGKPRHISPDKVSTRELSRVAEGYAADAKGPMSTPTPEGFRYAYVLVDLYAHHYESFLAKSMAEWGLIWQHFVKRKEAKAGRSPCISYVLTDGHRSNMKSDITAFNADRGIDTILSAPYSQWQDPAERGIQTIANGTRCSMIHGGGKAWMWGSAWLHATASIGLTKTPSPFLATKTSPARVSPTPASPKKSC